MDNENLKQLTTTLQQRYKNLQELTRTLRGELDELLY